MSTEDRKFLIKSDCNFLIDNFIEKLKINHPEYIHISCEDTEKFIDSVTAVNIFNEDKRIIILNDMDSDSLDAISAIIEQTSDDIWVLIQRQTVSRTKSFTIIKGACRLVELKEIDEAQCAVWVRKWLMDLKLIFSEEIPSYVVSRVGTDITKLHSEVRKVASYFSNSTDRILTQLNCNEFFSEDTEAKLFVVSENFFRKRVREVMEEVLKIDEYSFVKLLHMMIGQAERLYKVAIFKEQGNSVENIGELLGIPKFVVTTKLIPCLSFFNKTKLMMLLDLFNKLDVELRLTKFPKNLIIESYLLKAMKL
jgi:DNA polymerase III delta subunit